MSDAMAEGMHRVTATDLAFAEAFVAGAIPPPSFDHKSHLRLAYVFLATHGPDRAPSAFRDALLEYLRHHGIDLGKYHETLTRAWLHAVWLFMQRAGVTASSDEFLAKSEMLHDAKVMLTHYSKELLLGEEARRTFVLPDLDPIPGAHWPSHHR